MYGGPQFMTTLLASFPNASWARLSQPARLLTLALFFLASCICANPANQSMWEFEANQPVPEGAKVTLEIDDTDCVLGENVLVHFVLENVGNQPFEASFGGDSRSSRALRFIVTATDEAGLLVEDPDPWPQCHGGPAGTRVLQPGEKFITSLPLMRYRQIEKPGVHTIRATHDFGWKEVDRKRPVGETTIKFRLPNAHEAEQIVNQMATMPAFTSTLVKRTAPYADFRCLSHPVYLDILVRLARSGDKRAFEGLRFIPTLDATKALIQLAGDADKQLALNAANTLNERLPYPEFHFVPVLPNSSDQPILTIRGRLVERAWNESLVPDVRALANQLLSSEDPPTVAAAAMMMISVGTKEDAPAVLDAIKQSREHTLSPRSQVNDNIIDFPQPIRELLLAMDALRERGYSLGESIGGAAEILVYFHYLKDAPAPRPDRWLASLEAFGQSGWFPTREEAVRSIPQPMPAECIDFVRARLEDEDLGVCRAACTAAGASGNPAFIPPLLDLLRTEHDQWLLREATDAALKLGAGFELHEAWAERLSEARLYQIALDSLQAVLDVPAGYSGPTDLNREERIELRNTWKEFLELHAEEIKSGKRFKVTDPAVTTALAGRARSWKLPDGTYWPRAPY